MSFSRLRYHFVTATKCREPLITPETQPLLFEYMEEAAKDVDGKILELGGVEDHAHLVAAIRPTTAPAKFMRRVKAESTRRLRAEHPQFDHFSWQSGFGAFTLSPFDLRAVRSYVRNQKEHHREQSVWEAFELLEEIKNAA